MEKTQTAKATSRAARLVRTSRYVSHRSSSPVESSSGLDKALRNTYLQYLYGADEAMPPMVKALAYSIPPYKLAEQAVARLFMVNLPAGNAVGYDVDTTGVELDGVDYGKVEVRTASMRKHTETRIYPAKDGYETISEYVRFRADFVNRLGMKKKRANPADWFFCVLFDPEVRKLVWFRFPGSLVFQANSLIVTKSVKGGYGWADKYIWVGPENEF